MEAVSVETYILDLDSLRGHSVSTLNNASFGLLYVGLVVNIYVNSYFVRRFETLL